MRRILILLLLASGCAHAVSCSELTSGASTTDGTSFVTASVTPGSSHLILVAVVNTKASNADAISTITGNGLTYVTRGSTAFNASFTHRLSVWSALASSPSTGALTISYGAATQTGAAWKVWDCPSVDISGSNGAGAIAQIVQGSVSGGTSVTGTLGAFDGQANQYTIGFSATIANSTYTAGAGFALLGSQQNYATPTASIHGETQGAADTSVDMSFGSTTAILFALEIVAVKAGEVKRPTVEVDQNGVSSACGTGTQASAAQANAHDADGPITIAGDGVSSLASSDVTARKFTTWASASGTYSSLNLYVRMSCGYTEGGSPSTGTTGQCAAEYSTNGGGAWTTIFTQSFSADGNRAVSTSVVALSAAQNLANLQVRVCAASFDGPGVNGASTDFTDYDIRTEGVISAGVRRRVINP